jgi:hypothetical protein
MNGSDGMTFNAILPHISIAIVHPLFQVQHPHMLSKIDQVVPS